MASGMRWTAEAFAEAQKRGPKAGWAQPAPMMPVHAGAVNPLWVSRGVTITLPFPPTLNHMHMNIAKGRIRSKEYVAFCGIVEHICRREKIPPFGPQRLAVAILLHGPNKRAFDIDNRAKPVLDALQRAGVYADDEQVDRLTITRGAIVKGGLAIVTIEAM